MQRYFATLLIMVIRWPTPVPFTSKDRVAYQINGKTTMSKEKKMNKKDIWVGRLLLITCCISKQTSLLFSKTNTHISKTSYKTLKTFSKKDKHLCIHSYERESLQRLPKRMASFQNTFKITPSTISNNFKQSKWSKQVTKSPWKTMDEKGASTFPFHNLPPELKKISQRSFLFFPPFPF